MQVKKNPKARLENYSKVFIELGLVLALFITYQVLEIKTYDRTFEELGEVTMANQMEEDIPIVPRQEIKPPKTPPPPAPEKITVVENELDIEETIVDATETDENEAVEVIETETIVEETEDEDIIEDVPFVAIENAPIFPGCKGSKAELKACFTKSLQKYFSKNFDADLAQELGLSPGRKRLIVQFKIDHKGLPANVMARAPHPRIEQEVIGIIKSLPKMTPGSQRGRPVGVKYSLPILFHVKQ